MTFTHYISLAEFGADTLDILSENEVQNNLSISFIRNEHNADPSNWLLATIKDALGNVVLTAAWTGLPHNVVLYETSNQPNDMAIVLLANELKAMDISLPGVLSEQSLAQRFSACYAAQSCRHSSMHIMQLDRLNAMETAPGTCRPLREDDLFFAPYWKKAMEEDCRLPSHDISAYAESTKWQLNNGILYFIWEDGQPVSQAFSSRSTPNGRCVAGVYTPPHYRGKGYATSNVAALSQALLEHGNKFCFLFADASNPTSCGVYRKIGYQNVCLYDDIRFTAITN
ncbi:MAG: GNAT family N-acetyltransferase [Oscillospiraceae bacterium]|nr:GNAT family N-acetyltransferase [Oscillospiraceae bacterium]